MNCLYTSEEDFLSLHIENEDEPGTWCQQHDQTKTVREALKDWRSEPFCNTGEGGQDWIVTHHFVSNSVRESLIRI